MTKEQKATTERAARIATLEIIEEAERLATESIVYVLKSRLEARRRDLEHCVRGDDIREGTHRYDIPQSHHEGRIEELESIIKSLEG